MKRKNLFALLAAVFLIAVTTLTVWSQTSVSLKKGDHTAASLDQSSKIALAYVEDWRKGIPDANLFTHLVYAFAEFNEDNDGVVISKPEKLRGMSDLKKKNPELKVLLGLGGYKREGFSEMAGDRKKRKALVRNVKEIIEEYGLDGVDLDWEFPTTTDGGHTASPKDDRNYVTLVKDLRKALGKDKWISYYSNNSGKFIDHKRMAPYVSYVHVSGYNLSVPREDEKKSYHQSPLYSSDATGHWCVMESVRKHLELGVPHEKLLIGIPFFGRGRSPFPTYADCRIFDRYEGDLKPIWDDDSQAVYYADEQGNLLMGFDDERSIAAKMDFVRTNEFPGVFVWNYDSDFGDHRLAKALKRLRK
ncbi:MAG: hypothetical protein K2K93_09060 [Muribaculaceae bacterium]|nr:hypothetical protein [Muribaculaceae bacterium]